MGGPICWLQGYHPFTPRISQNNHSEQMTLVTYWGRISRTSGANPSFGITTTQDHKRRIFAAHLHTSLCWVKYEKNIGGWGLLLAGVTTPKTTLNISTDCKVWQMIRWWLALINWGILKEARLPKTKALRFQRAVDQLLCAAYQSDAWMHKEII